LRGALARIGRTIPNYRNITVDTAVASIFADKLKAVGEAVKAADVTQFNSAFRNPENPAETCRQIASPIPIPLGFGMPVALPPGETSQGQA
jgi:hypothetical protein